jgi:hypothetical protein
MLDTAAAWNTLKQSAHPSMMLVCSAARTHMQAAAGTPGRRDLH